MSLKKNMILDIHIINCVILSPGTGFCSSFCNHCEAIVKVSSGECKVRLRIVSAISQRYSAAENRMPFHSGILQQKTECYFTMVFCSIKQNAISQRYSAAENIMPSHNSILQQKTECHLTTVFCSRKQNAISQRYSAAENRMPHHHGILQQKTECHITMVFCSRKQNAISPWWIIHPKQNPNQTYSWKMSESPHRCQSQCGKIHNWASCSLKGDRPESRAQTCLHSNTDKSPLTK